MRVDAVRKDHHEGDDDAEGETVFNSYRADQHFSDENITHCAK